ncbi:conserved membrane hypothetical protein [Candidatus Sulfopaludibacter sp. SbA4]|nr:conserved membrane hypothetical protein [Candidatus Sulfopaludibacter sp. SbA4]
MNRFAVAACALALALLTFFQFPGHTWLQQDTQIYVPILEHQRDPTLLRNEILAEQPHVAYTLYDEAALFLRRASGLDFRVVLAFQQIVTRALGIWGLYMVATALGLAAGPSTLVAAICSLGAAIPGPQVLTFEYEPTPRAFAVPLLMCATGLAARKRYVPAGIAAAAAFLYHPPTALPFWAVFIAILIVRRERRALVPLAAAVVLLLIAAWTQAGSGESQTFLARLSPLQEQLQHMRTAYVWISTWPRSQILHHVILFAAALAAFTRIRRPEGPGINVSFELRMFLLGLPLLGLAAMPASWLLLEHWHWALVPQVQPMRILLFVALWMQLLTAAAGVYAANCRRPFEAVAWFALAYLLPLDPLVTKPLPWRPIALVLLLAAATAAAAARIPRFSPAVALAAFFAIPLLGGVVNYPHLHTPEIAQLSQWARTSTPKDAVFLFPGAGHALDPGIFRSEALRAVYVDWKGGGQVNYLRDFAEQWWFRWQQNIAPPDLPRYDALGIAYIVLRPPDRLPRPAAFENAKYVAYSVR